MFGYLIVGGVIALTIGLAVYGFGAHRGGIAPERNDDVEMARHGGFSAILGAGGEAMTDPDRGIIGPSDADVEAANSASD